MDIPPVLLLVAAGLILIGSTLMIAQAAWPMMRWPGISGANYSGLALVVLGVLVLLAAEALSPASEYAER